jgi:hypothetical protein
LKDEISLLRCVGQASRSLVGICGPLYWKPHPVISELPEKIQSELRGVAKQEGFSELSSDANIFDVAGNCKWVFSSPSTVAIDLLQMGILSLILDPQNTVLDTALSKLPQCEASAGKVLHFLDDISYRKNYSEMFDESYSEIHPAAPLKISW